MFKFRGKDKAEKAEKPATPDDPANLLSAEGEENSGALEDRMQRSRGSFGQTLKNMFRLRRQLDDELFEELETALLMADVGADTTMEIIDELTKGVKRRELGDTEAVIKALREQLVWRLKPYARPLIVDPKAKPYVILVVGVNGVGKTTTIGKLAKRCKERGLSVMLAAGDTFRAAAVEQLQQWGERNDVPVIAQQTGADSASVVFDAMEAAKARGVQILIADTAGRLHTKSNLMDELSKIRRVLKKLDAKAPHEVLLVIDGGTGQNALQQAEQFQQAAGVSGVVVTKLDGTAKGGIVMAVARQRRLPIRFIGVGEKIGDLRPFDAEEFVDAILPGLEES
ncbi:MAG: signal recognition particle-docking protein FtsY [Pseudomonadota bacterium]